MNEMLTIDMLKGQGIPKKSNPDKIAFMSLALIVPALVAISMLGFYFKNNVIISIDKQRIVNCQQSIGKMSEAAALLELSKKEKKYTDDCLAEVAKNLSRNIQWTPILVEIVETMPDSILLKGIDIKQDNIKEIVPSKVAGGGDVEVSIPIRILIINVTEKSGSDHGISVRNFQDSLRSSTVFGSLLDNISVSQGIDTFKGQDAVSYKIDCSFKPEL
ncbi:MAG: hypothetical protein A2Y10_19780 [Planctomycetes bacterium GWF2_41_51]|nr:MAG: hypothetical protein A2Y10_19780 [Planctomycetes bacterium GWF2_41_51]HBG28334.1 hypothetical protein [Phycisphaerales bacterium]